LNRHRPAGTASLSRKRNSQARGPSLPDAIRC
jgi:hypothetical protein